MLPTTTNCKLPNPILLSTTIHDSGVDSDPVYNLGTADYSEVTKAALQVGANAKIFIQFVRTIHSYNVTGPETGLNITKLDTADIQSRVQVAFSLCAATVLHGSNAEQRLECCPSVASEFWLDTRCAHTAFLCTA